MASLSHFSDVLEEELKAFIQKAVPEKLNQKQNIIVLTLWLLKGPKPPIRYGTELKNSIFLKQENHVSTLVLKQTLVVSLSLESQLCKNKLSFLQKVII